MRTDLQTLGLTAHEEVLYLLLVDSPPMTREELSLRWNYTDSESGAILVSRLEQHGLITTLAGSPELVAAIAPDVALADLAERRIADLTGAKDRATADLRDRWVQVERGVDARDVIEIIVGRSAIHQRVRTLEREAHEILAFDRPPYATEQMDNPLEHRKLQEGCTYRSVYEGSSLEYPGQMESIRKAVGLGEQARVLWGVPMKMNVADRKVAIVPLETAPETIEVAVVVHPSALLDSLCVLFDLLWERATPFGDPNADDTTAPVTTRDREPGQAALLTLMAAGIPDKAVARQLGVTERTVQRWVRATMAEHAAHTRFQLGLRVGRGSSPVADS